MPRRSFILAVFAAAVLAASPCWADPPGRPPKPYQAVPITLPAASTDPSFEAFRARVAVVAKKRRYSELAGLVDPQGFFWGRDFAHAFDARKPAVDNFAAAIRLEHESGSGWQALTALAEEPSAEPLASRPGVVCAPARPTYDAIALAQMLDETYGAGLDWAYPRTDHTRVHAAPDAKAAVVGTLRLNFVRRLGSEARDRTAASVRNRWARVVMPAGQVGYVAPGGLLSLTSEQLCYGKDAVGRWHITGFIAEGN
jgi:hypothetical protein